MSGFRDLIEAIEKGEDINNLLPYLWESKKPNDSKDNKKRE